MVPFILTDYESLVDILTSTKEEKIDVDHFKRLLLLFTPQLMEVNPIDICDFLLSQKVLGPQDVEEIRLTCRNDGKHHAVFALLHLISRGRNSEWFSSLMFAFKHQGYRHLVEKIAPDFLEASKCLQTIIFFFLIQSEIVIYMRARRE